MANEKRLINLDFAISKIKDEGLLGSGYSNDERIYDVCDMLKSCPTVDAVEVVHGRWIWSEEDECWICSNCEMSALNNYRGNSAESNYCPTCGAKMDGGNEDV